jgi:probable rRNA maturation factor
MPRSNAHNTVRVTFAFAHASAIASSAYIKRIAQQILAVLQIQHKTVELVLVSAQKMRSINRTYRHKDRATNVLSFELADADDPNFLGEIYVSPAVVIREARTLGVPPKDWLARLIVHGILHLVGYDHITPRDERRMVRKERELLSLLNIKIVVE